MQFHTCSAHRSLSFGVGRHSILVKMKPVTVNLIVWSALTLMVALFGSLAAWGASSITRHSAKTRGTVTQLFPRNHQSFEYTYTVASVSYSGTASGGAGRKIGDPLMVFFDQTHPSTSTLESADMPAIQSVGNVFAACAIIPFLIMLLLHHGEALPRWAPFDAVRPTSSAKNP